MLTSARAVTWRSEVPEKPCWANSSSAAPRIRSLVENCCPGAAMLSAPRLIKRRSIKRLFDLSPGPFRTQIPPCCVGAQSGRITAALSAKPASARGFFHVNLVAAGACGPLPGDLPMALERTLSIIKPDAVAKNVIGEIYSRFEKGGLKVVASKMKHLSRKEAEGFYAVHRERPFFNALVEFMISGPVMIQALEGENAIAKNRELMGATNPKEAAAGTIRADFADSIDANAVHGSDAAETAAVEIAYFFPTTDVYAR